MSALNREAATPDFAALLALANRRTEERDRYRDLLQELRTFTANIADYYADTDASTGIRAAALLKRIDGALAEEQIA